MTVGLAVILSLLLLAIKVPIGIALMTPAIIYIQLSPTSLGTAYQQLVGSVDSFTLLAIPMFILMGYLANEMGITERLFDVAEAFIGHVNGSLAYINSVVSFIFSWMSGAAVADAAGLGAMEIPAMRKRGFSTGISVGVTAASATIGPMMPPSIVAILFAVSAGVSIGGLFAAGVVPAFVLLVVLLLFTAYRLRLEPEIRLPKATWSHRARATRRSLLPLLTPVIILGGILGGFFTPTEAAAVAAGYMIFLGVISRNATFPKLYSVAKRAFITSASIMFVVAGAGLFAWMLTRERVPARIVEVLPDIIGHPIAFLLLLNIALLGLGMIIEPASAIIITAPVVLPVALELGIDPLHLGVVVIFNLIIGLITPPVGIIIYVLSSVTDLTPLEVTKAVLPFLVPLGIALLLFTLVPSISLWLPRTLGF